MIRAKDVMSRRVVAARPEMTVGQVADLLVRRRISGVPVVDKNRRPVGVISLADLVRRSRAPQEEKIPAFYREDGRVVVAPAVESESEVPASQAMTPAVLSADEKTPVAKLARFMLRWRIHRVMITAKGRLAGIVTSFDLLRVVSGRAH